MKTISASRMQTFYHCPLKYKYQYIYKLIQSKGIALEIGSRYHEILEHHHKDEFAEIAQTIQDNPHISEMLTHLYNKYKLNPVLGDVVETEERFTFRIDGVEPDIIGFMDRRDTDKGVEYKSAAKKWHPIDTETIQTRIYLYRLMQYDGDPKKLVYSVNNKKTKMPAQIIEVDKTREEILELEDEIRTFVENVKNSDFEPEKGSHCYMCGWGPAGDFTCPLHGAKD